MQTGWKLAALMFGVGASGAVALARQEPAPEVRRETVTKCLSPEEADRVPILEPGPGESDTASCLDPPSESEIWGKLPWANDNAPAFHEVQRNNARFLIEKIGDKVDRCKVYPLAGPCQLIHCHYKCTVNFDEDTWSDYPIPSHHTKHRVEVVYIDKDHLRRCHDATHAHGAKPDRAEAPRPVPDLEHRMAEVEKKLDRILEMLEDQKHGPDDGKPR